MAKKRLKNDHLAKLRQFKKGMDVEDFLATQHRQVIRALEESYVVPDDIDLSPYAKIADITTTPIVSGVHAIRTTAVTTTGGISFTQWHCPASAGTFNGTLFRPSKSGTYWIECDFSIASAFNNSPLDQIYFGIQKEPSSTLADYNVDIFTGTPPLIDDARQVYFFGKVSSWWQKLHAITTLSPTEGAFLNAFAASASARIVKITFKIYRIGD